jgi:hypothetical protein
MVNLVWLASGLERRGEYNRTMDLADMPRQGDLDGRRNLSLKALQEFVLWFLSCLDQVQFVSGPFDLNELKQRLLISVEVAPKLQAAALLEEALMASSKEKKLRVSQAFRDAVHVECLGT